VSRRARLVVAAAVALGIGLSTTWAYGAGITPTSKKIVTTTLNPPAFFVDSIVDTNVGANAGKLEAGDRSVVVFAGQVAQATLCSSWSNASSAQSLTGFTFGVNDNALGGNDTLTVTASPPTCASGFHFGTIDLKRNNYVTGGSASFTNSTIDLSQTATSTTLTLTLGTPGGTGTLVKVTTTSAAVFTPDTTITSSGAIAIGLNSSTTATAVQF
jgi:hypothetical protein